MEPQREGSVVIAYVEIAKRRSVPFVAAAVFCVTVSLASVAWYIAWSSDPEHQPGESYNLPSGLAGYYLRLLDSGKFVRKEWCDICGTSVSRGTWSNRGDTVVLAPNDGSKLDPYLSVLHRTRIGDCSFLVDEMGGPLVLHGKDGSVAGECEKKAPWGMFSRIKRH